MQAISTRGAAMIFPYGQFCSVYSVCAPAVNELFLTCFQHLFSWCLPRLHLRFSFALTPFPRVFPIILPSDINKALRVQRLVICRATTLFLICILPILNLRRPRPPTGADSRLAFCLPPGPRFFQGCRARAIARDLTSTSSL